MSVDEATEVAEEVAQTVAPKDVAVIDLEKLLTVATPSAKQTEEHLKLAAKLTQLETAVIYATQAKIEWLEVEEDILKHFSGGKLPDAGYVIYKNIKMCLANQAEELAKRDALTCHQVMFPKDSYMKVGVRGRG